MPQDSKGQELAVGDVVSVRCVVTSVFDSKDGINVNVRVLDGCDYKPLMACNSGSLVKVESQEATKLKEEAEVCPSHLTGSSTG